MASEEFVFKLEQFEVIDEVGQDDDIEETKPLDPELLDNPEIDLEAKSFFIKEVIQTEDISNDHSEVQADHSGDKKNGNTTNVTLNNKQVVDSKVDSGDYGNDPKEVHDNSSKEPEGKTGLNANSENAPKHGKSRVETDKSISNTTINDSKQPEVQGLLVTYSSITCPSTIKQKIGDDYILEIKGMQADAKNLKKLLCTALGDDMNFKLRPRLKGENAQYVHLRTEKDLKTAQTFLHNRTFRTCKMIAKIVDSQKKKVVVDKPDLKRKNENVDKKEPKAKVERKENVTPIIHKQMVDNQEKMRVVDKPDLKRKHENDNKEGSKPKMEQKENIKKLIIQREEPKPKVEQKENVRKPITQKQFLQEDYKKQIEQKTKDLKSKFTDLGNFLSRMYTQYGRLISNRKLKNDGLLCSVEDFKECPSDQRYSDRCKFYIGIDAETKEPAVGFQAEFGIVKKISEVKHDYPSHVIEAAKVFEKAVKASKLAPSTPSEKTRIWNEVIIRTNSSRDLMILVLVNCPAESSVGDLKKVKEELIEFFQNGEGKKCRVISLNMKAINKSKAKNVPGSIEVPQLLMGKPHIEETVLGFKILHNPTSHFWGNNHSIVTICRCVNGLLYPSKKISLLIIGSNIGLVGFYFSKIAGEVVCVDSDRLTEEAKMNAERNNIKNCNFLAGDTEVIISRATDKLSLLKSVAVIIGGCRRSFVSIGAMHRLRQQENLKRLVVVTELTKPLYNTISALCDPNGGKELGSPFFPVKVIPVDSAPNTNSYVVVMLMERISLDSLSLLSFSVSMPREPVSIKPYERNIDSRDKHHMKDEHKEMFGQKYNIREKEKYIQRTVENVTSRIDSYEQKQIVQQLQKVINSTSIGAVGNLPLLNEYHLRELLATEQRRLVEEKRRCLEEQQRIELEEQHRRLLEEQHRRQMEEEQHRRRMEEEQQRRRLEEERQMRLLEEERQMRLLEEEHERRQFEEEQLRIEFEEGRQRRQREEEWQKRQLEGDYQRSWRGKEQKQLEEEREDMRLRNRDNVVQNLISDSLKEAGIPLLSSDTAEKLKQVIAEAIKSAGVLGKQDIGTRHIPEHDIQSSHFNEPENSGKPHSQHDTKPGRKPLLELPGRKTLLELPGRKTLLELPGRKPLLELPGRKPLLELPGRKPLLELPGRKPLLELPGPKPLLELELEKPKELVEKDNGSRQQRHDQYEDGLPYVSSQKYVVDHSPERNSKSSDSRYGYEKDIYFHGQGTADSRYSFKDWYNQNPLSGSSQVKTDNRFNYKMDSYQNPVSNISQGTAENQFMYEDTYGENLTTRIVTDSTFTSSMDRYNQKPLPSFSAFDRTNAYGQIPLNITSEVTTKTMLSYKDSYSQKPLLSTNHFPSQSRFSDRKDLLSGSMPSTMDKNYNLKESYGQGPSLMSQFTSHRPGYKNDYLYSTVEDKYSNNKDPYSMGRASFESWNDSTAAASSPRNFSSQGNWNRGKDGTGSKKKIRK